MRNLAARVERLERRAPAKREADPEAAQWLCDHYPDLMSRWAELLGRFGFDQALRELSDDELDQLDAALRAAHEAMEPHTLTK